MASEDKDSSPVFSFSVSRLATPQLSGENLQMIEAKTELSRLVSHYGFSTVSTAWEWLVLEHNMETGDMLIDPSQNLLPLPGPAAAASTSPLARPDHHFRSFTPDPHPDIGGPSLSLNPHLRSTHSFVFDPYLHQQTMSMHEELMHAMDRKTPVVEFQFSMAPDDDDDDDGENVHVPANKP